MLRSLLELILRQPISWDDDVKCYAGKEISVELEYISCKMSNKDHNYVSHNHNNINNKNNSNNNNIVNNNN